MATSFGGVNSGEKDKGETADPAARDLIGSSGPVDGEFSVTGADRYSHQTIVPIWKGRKERVGAKGDEVSIYAYLPCRIVAEAQYEEACMRKIGDDLAMFERNLAVAAGP